MNPFPIIRATIVRHWAAFILFSLIIAVSIGIGITISAQERAIRQASARAADKFDILLAAPGSQLDVVLTAIYLRSGTVPLLEVSAFASALNDPRVQLAAPIAFGDSYKGAPIIGTTQEFITHLSGKLEEGSLFKTEAEAVIGAASQLKIGDIFKPSHGVSHADHDDNDNDHDINIKIIGRMQPTGTPWDRAIIVPIEQVWRTHSLPNGHMQGDNHIGPPFATDQLSPVPVVVIKPVSISSAYSIRANYRTRNSMAFFPAEVLVQLYSVMGNIQSLLNATSLATQLLVIVALMAGVFAILTLSKRQFAVLRVLGAPRSYIVLCIWSYVAVIILTGAALGTALGAIFVSISSNLISNATGIAMNAQIAEHEWSMVLTMISISFLLALYPAVAIAARKPLETLSGST